MAQRTGAHMEDQSLRHRLARREHKRILRSRRDKSGFTIGDEKAVPEKKEASRQEVEKAQVIKTIVKEKKKGFLTGLIKRITKNKVGG